MVPQQTARNMLPNSSWKNCFVPTLSQISPLMRPILLTGLILTQPELQVQFCVIVKVSQHLNDQTAVIKLKSPE